MSLQQSPNQFSINPFGCAFNKMDLSTADFENFLPLKNAKLIQGNATINFGFVTLFYDQIVGVTAGL